MKKSKLIIQNLRLFFYVTCFAFCVSAVSAQSTRIEFPTPVTSTEINGRIAARDIGDARSTTYYYVFNGTQGDIFLKIESSNLNGDIDIFYADNLRPLTKVSLYADSTPTQTAREIYLRKPEKLILRVEGKTPSDDPATFSIRFEGSFQAMAGDNSMTGTENPTLKNEVGGAVRVNSVGTILEIPVKVETEKTAADNVKKPGKRITTETASNDDAESAAKENLGRKRISVSGNKPEETTAETPAKKTTTARNKTPARRPARTTTAKTTTVKPPAERKPPVKTAAETRATELTAALENVRLVVLLKDGDKNDRPMSDILRFSVDKGTLTIIAKNGAISRYSILDVTKVSIE